MDVEYNHVVTEQPEISMIEDEIMNNRIDGHRQRDI